MDLGGIMHRRVPDVLSAVTALGYKQPTEHRRGITEHSWDGYKYDRGDGKM